MPFCTFASPGRHGPGPSFGHSLCPFLNAHHTLPELFQGLIQKGVEINPSVFTSLWPSQGTIESMHNKN
jgi:hypothetical protein